MIAGSDNEIFALAKIKLKNIKKRNEPIKVRITSNLAAFNRYFSLKGLFKKSHKNIKGIKSSARRRALREKVKIMARIIMYRETAN